MKDSEIKDEMLKCPFCEDESIVKNGIIKYKGGGRQRFLCKSCGQNFYPDFSLLKIDKCRQAIIMYLEGLDYTEIGKILKVDRYTVRAWIKKYGKDLDDIRNKRIIESGRIEEIHAVIINNNNKSNKPVAISAGFTIIEKEDKTHLAFLKKNQCHKYELMKMKEEPVEHIIEKKTYF